MFDVKATQAWWNFFHRFSQIYQGDNFDHIVLLGINLLQCDNCRTDGSHFYKNIGKHKSNFEKVHILHNYVNRKLKKQIVTLDQCKRWSSDIFVGPNVNWEKMLEYYFNLIFLMSKYVAPKQLDELKEFSAFVYQSLNLPKKLNQNAIQVNSREKASREQIQLQTFDYYNKTISSISNMNIPFQNYKTVFGKEPKKQRTCSSCAKRHKMYMERHQLNLTKEAIGAVSERRRPAVNSTINLNAKKPKSKSRVVPMTEIRKLKALGTPTPVKSTGNKKIIPVPPKNTTKSKQKPPTNMAKPGHVPFLRATPVPAQPVTRSAPATTRSASVPTRSAPTTTKSAPAIAKPPQLVPLPGNPVPIKVAKAPREMPKAIPKAKYDLPIEPKRHRPVTTLKKPAGTGRKILRMPAPGATPTFSKEKTLQKVPKKPNLGNRKFGLRKTTLTRK